MKKFVILFSLILLTGLCLGFTKGNSKPSISLEGADKNKLVNSLTKLSSDTLLPEETNPIVSPLGLYLVLSMMNETLNEEYQQEILNYFGEDSMTSLRNKNEKIVNAYLKDSLAEEFNLKNYLYLESEKIDYFNQDIITIIENKYKAKKTICDLYRDAAQSLSDTIKTDTNGFLDVSPNDLQRYLIKNEDALTVNILMNIIYFKDTWSQKFERKEIISDQFTNIDGNTKQVDMLTGSRFGQYYYNDNYEAGTMDFKNGCRMYFILPNEDVPLADVCTNTVLNELLSTESYNGISAEIYYNIPKFDINYKIELESLLMKKGIINAYTQNSDSQFYQEKDKAFGYYKTIQTSRIKLDEDGVKAATATISFGCGSKSAGPSAQLILNRPFVYHIVSPDNLVLFSGAITNL